MKQDQEFHLEELEVLYNNLTDNPKDYQALHRRGEILYGLEKYADAAYNFRAATIIKKDEDYTWYMLGKTYSKLFDLVFETKKINDALDSYNEAIYLNKNNAYYYYDRAILQYKLGQYNDAINDYKNASILNPDLKKDADIEIEKINEEIEKKANEEREKYDLVEFEKLLLDNPDDNCLPKYVKRLNNLYDVEAYREIIDSCLLLIENINHPQRNITNSKFWYWLGKAKIKIENNDTEVNNIIKCFELSLLVEKENIQNYWEQRYSIPILSIIQSKNFSNSKEVENAIISSFYRIKNDIDIDKCQGWYHEGDIYKVKRQYEESIKSYLKIIDNKNIVTIKTVKEKKIKKLSKSLVGIIEQKSCDYVFSIIDKIKVYKNCEIEKIWIRIWMESARILYDKRKFLEANKCYVKVIKDDSSNPVQKAKSYYWIGKSYFKLSNQEERQKQSNKNKILDNFQQIQISYLEKSLEAYQEATTIYKNLHDYSERLADSYLGLGEVYAARGNQEEAIFNYRNAKDSFSSKPIFWKRLAVTVTKQDGINKGVEIFDDAIHYFRENICQNFLNKNQEEERNFINNQHILAEIYYEKGKLIESKKTQHSFSSYKESYKDAYQEIIKSGFYSYISIKILKHTNQQELKRWIQLYFNILESLIKVEDTKKDKRKHLESGQKFFKQVLYVLGKQEKELNNDLKQMRSYIEKKYEFFDKNNSIETYLITGQETNALVFAENKKDICLNWLYQYINPKKSYLNYELLNDDYGNFYQKNDFYNLIKKNLLNSSTAAIYWHISSIDIITFILLPDESSPIIRPASLVKKSYDDKRLTKFFSWIQEWNNAYSKEDGEEFKTKILNVEKLKKLSDILEIEKIIDIVINKTGIKINQLILIPHKELYLLPLHVLFSTEVLKKEIPKFIITCLPSLKIGLKLNSILEPVRGILTIDAASGGKPLAYSELEATGILAIYENLILDGNYIKSSEARYSKIRNRLESETNYNYFHFTGHAYHDLKKPKKSALVLGTEDKLNAEVILKSLSFENYYVVSLSACETGLTSEENPIDEYVGLVSAFLAKGASYIISSLWKVNEMSTAFIMINFYQRIKDGHHPALALKEAQEWLRIVTRDELVEWLSEYIFIIRNYKPTAADVLLSLRNNLNRQLDEQKLGNIPFKGIYYWAGFVITGNPHLSINTYMQSKQIDFSEAIALHAFFASLAEVQDSLSLELKEEINRAGEIFKIDLSNGLQSISQLVKNTVLEDAYNRAFDEYMTAYQTREKVSTKKKDEELYEEPLYVNTTVPSEKIEEFINILSSSDPNIKAKEALNSQEADTLLSKIIQWFHKLDH
ncbi:CHAT domain-containing protein [Nostoc sp. C110]|uniref:CHAT domain-containing protein n=1 Tax=Nostoc sp. C110 TaxID=3349876 RepID=UPI00370DB484